MGVAVDVGRLANTAIAPLVSTDMALPSEGARPHEMSLYQYNFHGADASRGILSDDHLTTNNCASTSEARSGLVRTAIKSEGGRTMTFLVPAKSFQRDTFLIKDMDKTRHTAQKVPYEYDTFLPEASLDRKWGQERSSAVVTATPDLSIHYAVRDDDKLSGEHNSAHSQKLDAPWNKTEGKEWIHNPLTQQTEEGNNNILNRAMNGEFSLNVATNREHTESRKELDPFKFTRGYSFSDASFSKAMQNHRSELGSSNVGSFQETEFSKDLINELKSSGIIGNQHLTPPDCPQVKDSDQFGSTGPQHQWASMPSSCRICGKGQQHNTHGICHTCCNQFKENGVRVESLEEFKAFTETIASKVKKIVAVTSDNVSKDRSSGHNHDENNLLDVVRKMLPQLINETLEKERSNPPSFHRQRTEIAFPITGKQKESPEALTHRSMTMDPRHKYGDWKNRGRNLSPASQHPPSLWINDGPTTSSHHKFNSSHEQTENSESIVSGSLRDNLKSGSEDCLAGNCKDITSKPTGELKESMCCREGTSLTLKKRRDNVTSSRKIEVTNSAISKQETELSSHHGETEPLGREAAPTLPSITSQFLTPKQNKAEEIKSSQNSKTNNQTKLFTEFPEKVVKRERSEHKVRTDNDRVHMKSDFSRTRTEVDMRKLVLPPLGHVLNRNKNLGVTQEREQIVRPAYKSFKPADVVNQRTQKSIEEGKAPTSEEMLKLRVMDEGSSVDPPRTNTLDKKCDVGHLKRSFYRNGSALHKSTLDKASKQENSARDREQTSAHRDPSSCSDVKGKRHVAGDKSTMVSQNPRSQAAHVVRPTRTSVLRRESSRDSVALSKAGPLVLGSGLKGGDSGKINAEASRSYRRDRPEVKDSRKHQIVADALPAVTIPSLDSSKQTESLTTWPEEDDEETPEDCSLPFLVSSKLPAILMGDSKTILDREATESIFNNQKRTPDMPLISKPGSIEVVEADPVCVKNSLTKQTPNKNEIKIVSQGHTKYSDTCSGYQSKVQNSDYENPSYFNQHMLTQLSPVIEEPNFLSMTQEESSMTASQVNCAGSERYYDAVRDLCKTACVDNERSSNATADNTAGSTFVKDIALGLQNDDEDDSVYHDSSQILQSFKETDIDNGRYLYMSTQGENHVESGIVQVDRPYSSKSSTSLHTQVNASETYSDISLGTALTRDLALAGGESTKTTNVSAYYETDVDTGSIYHWKKKLPTGVLLPLNQGSAYNSFKAMGTTMEYNSDSAISLDKSSSGTTENIYTGGFFKSQYDDHGKEKVVSESTVNLYYEPGELLKDSKEDEYYTGDVFSTIVPASSKKVSETGGANFVSENFQRSMCPVVSESDACAPKDGSTNNSTRQQMHRTRRRHRQRPPIDLIIERSIDNAGEFFSKALMGFPRMSFNFSNNSVYLNGKDADVTNEEDTPMISTSSVSRLPSNYTRYEVDQESGRNEVPSNSGTQNNTISNFEKYDQEGAVNTGFFFAPAQPSRTDDVWYGVEGEEGAGISTPSGHQQPSASQPAKTPKAPYLLDDIDDTYTTIICPKFKDCNSNNIHQDEETSNRNDNYPLYDQVYNEGSDDTVEDNFENPRSASRHQSQPRPNPSSASSSSNKGRQSEKSNFYFNISSLSSSEELTDAYENTVECSSCVQETKVPEPIIREIKKIGQIVCRENVERDDDYAENVNMDLVHEPNTWMSYNPEEDIRHTAGGEMASTAPGKTSLLGFQTDPNPRTMLMDSDYAKSTKEVPSYGGTQNDFSDFEQYNQEGAVNTGFFFAPAQPSRTDDVWYGVEGEEGAGISTPSGHQQPSASQPARTANKSHLRDDINGTYTTSICPKFEDCNSNNIHQNEETSNRNDNYPLYDQVYNEGSDDTVGDNYESPRSTSQYQSQPRPNLSSARSNKGKQSEESNFYFNISSLSSSEELTDVYENTVECSNYVQETKAPEPIIREIKKIGQIICRENVERDDDYAENVNMDLVHEPNTWMSYSYNPEEDNIRLTAGGAMASMAPSNTSLPGYRSDPKPLTTLMDSDYARNTDMPVQRTSMPAQHKNITTAAGGPQKIAKPNEKSRSSRKKEPIPPTMLSEANYAKCTDYDVKALRRGSGHDELMGSHGTGMEQHLKWSNTMAISQLRMAHLQEEERKSRVEMTPPPEKRWAPGRIIDYQGSRAGHNNAAKATSGVSDSPRSDKNSNGYMWSAVTWVPRKLGIL